MKKSYTSTYFYVIIDDEENFMFCENPIEV